MGKDQELLDACRTGNLVVAEKLLSAKLAAKGRGPKSGSGGGGAFSLIKSISSLKGANVNCTDNSGDTPLHLAALNGHLEIVSLLLDCDANPTILDSQDCSPLHLAAWSGHTTICNELIASDEGHALHNLQTRDGNTALHFAAQHGHIDVLSLLLQKGGDPSIRNLEDKSPLDLAAQYDRLDIVRQLVTSHPELVVQRSVQNTPLHLASRLGHRAVVKYLLDSGFPIDAKTDKGTALHEAATYCKLDVIRLLLERGIDISVKSQTSCTAEDILRSIPSRAAEEALNILKTHIYHQRTPDSDGEKSIVGDLENEDPPPNISQALPTSSNVIAPVPIDRKLNMLKSLPKNIEVLAPPPIPPRVSMNVLDRNDNPASFGLPDPHVPSSTVSFGSAVSDDNVSPCASLTTKDISPSSKSPSELPKKPPRKKPLSFRRPDQASSLSSHPENSAMRSSNYVNLDPEVERALVEKQLESKNTDAVTSSSLLQERDKNSQLNSQRDNETDCQTVGKDIKQTSLAEEANKTSDVMEFSTSPPSSLDIKSAASCVSESAPEASVHIQSMRRQQPPTPDCPPPSPSTALLNIQRQILPGEKRRSKDMETITDASLTGRSEDEEEVPEETEPDMINMRANSDTSAATLPRASCKKKPLPLPRKSSLTADTKDLPTASPPADTAQQSSPLVWKEGYDGGKPVSKSAPPIGHCMIRNSDHKGLPQEPNSLRQSEELNIRGSGHVVVVPEAKVAGSKEGMLARRATLDATRTGGSAMQRSEAVDEGDEEPVRMRRSLSADNNNGAEWEGHAFAGLLRGSVVGAPRDVGHQFGGSNVTAAGLRRKRKSTKSMFAPVMEESKDMDNEKLFNQIDNLNLHKTGDTNDDVFDDFSDDWDQIAETISSYGGRISSSGDYAFFEAQIDQLLSAKGTVVILRISATFETIGVGLSRESVFMREHEDNFAKFLTAGKKDTKLQSVGSWLSEIGLAQYENTLVANGFDDTDFLGGNILEDADLALIGVDSPYHRRSILDAARKLPPVQTIDPDNMPSTVAEWLGSLRLDYYYDTFMSHKYDSMSRVIQLWEFELVTVLDITSVGHRKRILASLGEKRPNPIISPARPRVPSFGEPVKSPFDHVDLYRDYTGARSKVNYAGNDTELEMGAPLEFDSSSNGSLHEGQKIQDDALHLRAPHLMHETGAIKQWRHKPEILIKGCCNYTAHYLGSTLVKELKGAMSTQEGIAKLKKSSAVISKIPTIMLSISFKGVKFIDAASKKVVCDHEIANIFCACQDGEHMNFFAYITKDKQAGLHYCHVFSVRSRELAGEIILTLGEAFEIAYQMALKEKAEQEAERFDKLCSTSDGDDANSLSSKASTNTV